MKKAEKEHPEIKADPVKSGNKTDPLTPEELREMYVMVKEIYHQLGLGPRQRSSEELHRMIDIKFAELRERQARKEARKKESERQGKKE